MSNIPEPVKEGLSKGSKIGAVLGVLAIILFIVLWIGLGQLGLAQAPRLFGAMCIPPAVIAGILGAYLLIVRPGDKPQQ